MLKVHRELIRRLTEAGVTITNYERRSNTHLIECVLHMHTFKYFVSSSPSDHRAMENAYHEIMRGLRAKEAEHGNAHA